MTLPHRLEPAERDFFSLVARAVFTNPFSDERREIDVQLMGGETGPGRPTAEVSRRVIDRMQGLETQGRADLRLYSGGDREILEYAFLFDIYHRFKDELDRHILEQLEAGDEPSPVPFARDALGLLRARGFEAETACRNFALFFQLRRAFYFIDRALTGESPSMKALRHQLWNNIFTSDIRWYDRYLLERMEDFSTLLLGETGTGKGSAAAAIGRSGFIPFDEQRGRFAESFTRAFVALNLSQFPETLIESELFGHKKGAFTGAVDDHEGVFSRCSPHGSIFLDEIGEAGPPVQIKLLAVLQDRVFTPVGSQEKLRFRGRVIAATNRSMEELRGERARLRDDFFYRLSSDIIVVPPLRQRIAEDPRELDGLIAHCVRRILGEEALEIVAMVREVVGQQLGPKYAWPGNVRELEQCVRRVLLKRRYEGAHRCGGGDPRSRIASALDGDLLGPEDLLNAYCALLHEREGTYDGVARLTGLDRRTVRKRVLAWKAQAMGEGPRDPAAAGDEAW